jgi:hypothetical protein
VTGATVFLIELCRFADGGADCEAGGSIMD